LIDNILVDDLNDFSSIKIADFGLSAAYDLKNGISFSKQCGTMIFMAPEFFTSKVYSKVIFFYFSIFLFCLKINNSFKFFNELIFPLAY
jgi:serine/threonine protein kinase